MFCHFQCTLFMLHFFCVAIFSCCTFFVLHCFSVVALSLCCTFPLSHSFHLIFVFVYVCFFLTVTVTVFPCCTRFRLHFLQIALFSYYTLFMLLFSGYNYFHVTLFSYLNSENSFDYQVKWEYIKFQIQKFTISYSKILEE